MTQEHSTPSKLKNIITKKYILFSVFALLSCVYISHSLLFNFFIMDDAGISYSYAKNIFSGIGARLCPGSEIIEGYSNPLWVFFIGALMKLHLFHPIYTLKIVGLILSLMTVYICIIWLEQIFKSPNHSLCFYLFFPLLLFLHTPYVVWNVSGLENPLYNFLLILALYLFAREIKEPDKKQYYSALIFFLLSITRPEGAMYFVLAAFVKTVFYKRKVISAAFVKWTLLFLIPFLIYHILHYSYFQSMFPNTYYAKTENLTGILRLINVDKRGWQYVTGYFKDTGFFILLPVIALSLRALLKKSPRDFALPLILFLVIPVYTIWIVGDWMFQYRFMVHYSIILSMLFISGSIMLSEWIAKKYAFIPPVVLSLVICFFVLFIIGRRALIETPKAIKNPSTTMPNVKSKAEIYNSIFQQAMIQNPSVLEVDAGATSYYGKFDIIDLAKLADVHIAKYNWEDYFGDYIFRERKPVIIHSQGYYTKSAAWERFEEIKSEYSNINVLVSNEFNCIRKDVYSNPDTTPTVEINRRISESFILKGYTIYTPFIYDNKFKPFLTIYWETGSGKIQDDIKIKFSINGQDINDDWLYPLHRFANLSNLANNAQFFEHHRLSLPRIESDKYVVELKVKINNREENKIRLGTVEINKDAFVKTLNGESFNCGLSSGNSMLRDLKAVKQQIWIMNELFNQSFETGNMELISELNKIGDAVSANIKNSLNDLMQSEDLSCAFILLRLTKSWRYDPGKEISALRHNIAERCLKIANQLYEKGDLFSLTQAFIYYSKSIQSSPDFPLARKRMEIIRPVFYSVNNVFDKRLYQEDIDFRNISEQEVKNAIVSCCLINKFKPVAVYAKKLNEREKTDLFSDPAALSCIITSAKICRDEKLIEFIMKIIKTNENEIDSSQFKPLQFLLNKEISADEIHETQNKFLSSAFQKPLDFGAFIIKDITFEPIHKSSSQCIVYVTVQRKKTVAVPYYLKLTGIPGNKELLKQNEPNRDFLLRKLKPKLQFRKLPKNEDVVIPFAIDIADGEYKFSVMFEFNAKVKVFTLKTINDTSSDFNIVIKRNENTQ